MGKEERRAWWISASALPSASASAAKPETVVILVDAFSARSESSASSQPSTGAGQLLNHHRKISVQLPAARHPAALDPAIQTRDIGDPAALSAA